MTDREKLVDIMRDSKAIGYWWFEETIAEFVDYLIANGVVIQKWIPVTERLPEIEGYYLCCVRSCLFPEKTYLRILMCNKYGFSDGGIYTDNVTHWMPMPEAPKEE